MKVKLDQGAYMPERAHELDAGYDLMTPGRFVVGSFTTFNGDGMAMIDTGIHVEIPAGHVGFLKSKSGLNVHHNLTCDGTIDAGYTGSIIVKIYNHGPEPYTFQRGDKVAQLVIVPIVTPDLEQVQDLAETERGSNGFGSTGR